MSSFGKFRAAVISKAVYDEGENVGYSTVQEDFPMVLGPLAVHDQVDILMKPWGRSEDGLPLFINEAGVDRWTGTINTHGVNSSSAYATPSKDTIPAACIVIVQVTSASVLAAIDGAAKHFVLGIDNPDLNGDELPAGLLPYDWDVTFPPARWTELRNALVSLGLDAEVIDGWHDNNPDATPRDFGESFKKLIQ